MHQCHPSGTRNKSLVLLCRSDLHLSPQQSRALKFSGVVRHAIIYVIMTPNIVRIASGYGVHVPVSSFATSWCSVLKDGKSACNVASHGFDPLYSRRWNKRGIHLGQSPHPRTRLASLKMLRREQATNHRVKTLRALFAIDSLGLRWRSQSLGVRLVFS